VANDRGQIIGVLSMGTDNGSSDGLSGARPINLLQPLLQAADSGRGYESPFASALPPDARITDIELSHPGSAVGIESGCDTGGRPTDRAVAFAVDYQRF